MGLFDLFRKKQQPKKEIQEDFDPLNIDSVIRYIKAQRPGMSDKEAWKLFEKINKPAKDQNHLTKDGELPTGWYYLHKDFIEKVQREYSHLLNQWFDKKHKSVTEQYAALKALVTYIDNLRKTCNETSECHAYWLSEKFCLIDDDYNSFVEKLKYMEEHMDELLQHENTLKKLRVDLKKIIQAEPGVKQEYLYKRFDQELKNDIRNELYIMADQGIIRREKSGRTYSLFIKQK